MELMLSVLQARLLRHIKGNEEFYEHWLSLYEKHYDEAMEIIVYFKDFFGDYTLK